VQQFILFLRPRAAELSLMLTCHCALSPVFQYNSPRCSSGYNSNVNQINRSVTPL